MTYYLYQQISGKKVAAVRIKDVFLHRQIVGEHMLIPAGEAALRLHGMICLTESGYLLYENLRSDCSLDELIAAVLNEYDVSEEQARQDVLAFLDKLRSLDVLIEDVFQEKPERGDGQNEGLY